MRETDDEKPEDSPAVAPPVEGVADETDLVVITGMSGAGRSRAIHTFEDLGYFCIDNLPPAFIRQLVDLTRLPGSRIRRIAVVCDVRAKEFFEELEGELRRLEEAGVPFHLLFLEADEDVLVRRFKETRRLHPLCAEGDSVVDAIAAERDALADIRERADFIIDTSELKPAELGLVIRERFLMGSLADSLGVTVVSFGFKYGVPSDADIVMDVRFLPNPYYNTALRERTGLEEPVRRFVLERPETHEFIEKWYGLLQTVVPGYLIEGKTHLVIALGCTGGMHRSVALAEETAGFLAAQGFRVAVSHRDIARDRQAR
ncbi:MAG TPA: RNase adapter RapZ [Coriobacteriia bacterium]|nr:RNase adapter RapZ [Coriobacteriia bacterium]